MKGIEILNLMGKSSKKLLVHKDIPNITIKKNIDIILTPQFYTFLKEELGIKFAYQAKQIAPSLFDDYLDKNKEYQYYVYKCDGVWCFFAYDIEEITSFLEEKGVKKHQIGKIFFAQELEPHLQKAMSLSQNKALMSIDGVVTVIPKKLLDNNYEYQELDLLDNINLNHGVSIGSSYSSLIPLKETIISTILLLILGGIYIFEGINIKESINNDMRKLESLLDKNPKLSSNRIRQSIIQEYVPIDKEERKKRDLIYKISKLLSSSTKLKALLVDDKKIIAVIETKNISNLKRKAQKANLKVKQKGNEVIVESGL
jgi:hypothetical protein